KKKILLSVWVFVSAEPEKPGVCPKNPEVALLGGCVERCSHDSDCPKDEKCCSKGCGQQCMPPYREKPGVCPSKNLGIGVCAELCSHDSDCPNDEKCCRNGCGHQFGMSPKTPFIQY
uniref:WAP domain-containing protein n=1 Tax=Sinocyclocheilus grahami TaxID=75366 RepID=A0A672K7H3_SINGR